MADHGLLNSHCFRLLHWRSHTYTTLMPPLWACKAPKATVTLDITGIGIPVGWIGATMPTSHTQSYAAPRHNTIHAQYLHFDSLGHHPCSVCTGKETTNITVLVHCSGNRKFESAGRHVRHFSTDKFQSLRLFLYGDTQEILIKFHNSGTPVNGKKKSKAKKV